MTWYKAHGAANWQTLFAIVQAVFPDGILNENSTWHTVVLITKGGSGYFQGIGLIEVLCKTVTIFLNRRFTAAITFHDVLHRFWAGRGTGTSNLKSKLLHNLVAMREAVLYKVFLDLQKAYDALDWESCLGIIVVYRVDPMMLRILRAYWVQLAMVARYKGYYIPPFKQYLRVT